MWTLGIGGANFQPKEKFLRKKNEIPKLDKRTCIILNRSELLQFSVYMLQLKSDEPTSKQI
jgi:hypothetical protein